MPALTTDRDTPKRGHFRRSFPVKGASKIFAGSIACIDTTSGFAQKGVTATTLTAVGVATETVDNTGANGALSIETEPGVFRFANSASGDLITLADVDKACFIVDDQTVAKTNGGSTRSQAGIVRDVDAVGVWVEIGLAR